MMEKLQKEISVLLCKMEKKFPPEVFNPMVGNRKRVEGCITEAFTLKEVAIYFSSVYFAEEHNVNTPTMWYNIYEEPPCSGLSIFYIEGHSYW
jgi:hypothetical protein